MSPAKAKVQAAALGVVEAWLKRENHYQEDFSDQEAKWVEEVQNRVASWVESEATKLRALARRK